MDTIVVLAGTLGKKTQKHISLHRLSMDNFSGPLLARVQRWLTPPTTVRFYTANRRHPCLALRLLFEISREFEPRPVTVASLDTEAAFDSGGLLEPSLYLQPFSRYSAPKILTNEPTNEPMNKQN